MRLHATVAGEGPPLVLLHGFTGNVETWRPYRSLLPHRRLIAIDLPGHGRSSRPVAGATFDDLADEVVAAAEQAGARRAGWLGYSMGGRVALHVALRAAGRVERLVVESASPGIDDDAERLTRCAADEELATRIEGEGLECFVDRWAAQPLFASQARLPPETLERERRVRLAGSAGGIAAGLRAMGVGRQPSAWAALGDLGVPTRVIVGELDEKYVGIGRRMAAALPRGDLCIVPGAGHTVHLERPAAFWRLVREFLEAVPEGVVP